MDHRIPLTVVTGSSGGIGTAVTNALVARGHHVIGLDPDSPTVHHEHYEHLRCDVTNAHDVAVKLGELDGRVQHVVAVAGRVLSTEYALIDRRADTGAPALPPVDTFTRSVELNLLGAYHVVAACADDLVTGRGNRTITFCGSINATRGYGAVAYSAAKAGLSGLTIALAAELGPHGVRVNTIAPGTTPTPRTEARAATRPGHFDALAARSALRRVATPDDIAATFTALICDLTHITGQTIVVDGGQVIST
jgi:NAD(P)-dependent dehydrogenase (short-subunit alcohol dehydrogenase family)